MNPVILQIILEIIRAIEILDAKNKDVAEITKRVRELTDQAMNEADKRGM